MHKYQEKLVNRVKEGKSDRDRGERKMEVDQEGRGEKINAHIFAESLSNQQHYN